MTIYTVQIERSEGWWAISVPELKGVFSQARRRADVEPMARDAIALYLDVPGNSFGVDIQEVSASGAPLSH